MLDDKTKNRIIKESHLPTHDECEAKKSNKKQLSALEGFVYDHEPVDDGEFRDQLREAIIEAREAEAERSRGLEAGIEILKELCQLKHHKDTVGKDAHYEKRQPELWKLANEFLSQYNNAV